MSVSMPIELRVEGEPVPQPRPRFDPRSGRAYPGNERIGAWKQAVAMAAVAAGVHHSGMDEPYVIFMDFALPRPREHHVGRDRSRPLRGDHADDYHTAKPDPDNLGKAVLDALVDVGAVPDDRMCQCMAASKRYTRPGEPPGVEVRVELAGDVEW